MTKVLPQEGIDPALRNWSWLRLTIRPEIRSVLFLQKLDPWGGGPDTCNFITSKRTNHIYWTVPKGSVKSNCEVHYCPSCHKKCDSFGDHSLLCYADGNPTRRLLWHDQLTRTMSNYMYCHGIPCSYEPKHLFPDTGKRPDLIAHWPNYSVAFDTRTCVACKGPSKAASQKGYAAN